jgi:Na+/proline symporter
MPTNITTFDWFVVVAYLIGVTTIGAWASRKVSSSASFFISNRTFGKLFMTFLQFGTGTQSDEAVSVASKTFTNGVSGIWYQWLWLPVTPFYWIIGLIIRRLRAVTIADYFEKRYDRSVALLYAALALLQLITVIGLMLKGTAVTIEAVSGGQLEERWIIASAGLLFVLYGTPGGLTATILTDLLQGILIIVFSFLILPFALEQVGGMTGIRQAVDNPEKVFSLVAPGEISLFYISILSLNALIGFITSPTAIVTGAGKTEMQSQFGLVAGSIMKRICTIAWTLTGLCALALYGGSDINPDQIYGMMAHQLLPMVAPGLLGLFIAALLATQMSTCSASMVCASGLFTRNMYQPFVQPNRDDRHYIAVGRVAAVLVVALSLLYAYRLESVIRGLELFWEIAAVMGVTAWAGLVWRRASVAGAWAGTLTTFAVWACLQDVDLGFWQWNAQARIAEYAPSFMLSNGELQKPWHMISYLLSGLVALVVVSLATKPVSARQLDEFFDCLRTPVSVGEPEGEPCTLPAGVMPAPRQVLVQNPDFEIPVPSVTTVVGFLATALTVSLIVLMSVWIFSLGQ